MNDNKKNLFVVGIFGWQPCHSRSAVWPECRLQFLYAECLFSMQSTISWWECHFSIQFAISHTVEVQEIKFNLQKGRLDKCNKTMKNDGPVLPQPSSQVCLWRLRIRIVRSGTVHLKSKCLWNSPWYTGEFHKHPSQKIHQLHNTFSCSWFKNWQWVYPLQC